MRNFYLNGSTNTRRRGQHGGRLAFLGAALGKCRLRTSL